MNLLGIMQGRLSPSGGGRIQAFPTGTWQVEFPRAQSCGLDLIEWIFDADDWSANPLVDESGITAVKQQMAATGVKVKSICADYFMREPLTAAQGHIAAVRSEMLKFVAARAAMLGATYVTVPFVDQSAINSELDLNSAATALSGCIPSARAAKIKLCLETNLAPDRLADLLSTLDEDVVKVTYDIGNSAALGHNPADEIAAYGDRIAVVHVKDRVRDGGTVPLGTGAADLPFIFDALGKVGFAGPFILQVARRSDEMQGAREDARFVRACLNGQAA